MKIKKHLVAATLAVGLVGSATAMAPPSDSMKAQIGYVIAQYAFNNNGLAQAGSQAGVGAAGGLFGLYVGRKIGKRAATFVGARVGATIGAAAGPAGAVIGAVAGAM